MLSIHLFDFPQPGRGQAETRARVALTGGSPHRKIPQPCPLSPRLGVASSRRCFLLC
jgi:hypothetical protein